MGDASTWAWVWLLATGTFVVGEMFTPGSFFLLPFAVGALVACIAAFAGAGLVLQWALFLVVAAVASLSFIPLRKRLDRTEVSSDGVGARRLLHQPAVVLRAIPPGPDAMGMVRVGREEWRALSQDHVGIPEGTTVHVVEVRGTGVVVSTTVPTPGGHP